MKLVVHKEDDALYLRLDETPNMKDENFDSSMRSCMHVDIFRDSAIYRSSNYHQKNDSTF